MIPVLFDLDEQDVVKWILAFLFKRHLALSELTLERECEVMNSEHFLADLRQIIVEGDWKMADELILSLRVDEMVCRRIRFLLKRQQVFECFQQWKRCKDVETSSNEMQQCVQEENGCTEQDDGMQNGMQWCVEQNDFIQKQNGRYLEPQQHFAKECCNVYTVALHHYSELKELKSGDDDFPDLSELLDINYNADDSDLLDYRITCFNAIYPLVCKALPACIDKMADKTDDRLIELLVKGCFFESFEEYFRSKANCEELYVNNGPRTNLTRSSGLTVVSLVAKLLSDVDASLPLTFTAETVELKASIMRCEKDALSSEMTRLDNSLQRERVTVIPKTKSLLQFSISDASATQVCDVDFNEKNNSKCQEESSLLLDGILLSKPEIVNDSGCEKLEFVPSSVMIMRNSESDIPDSHSSNGWNEGLTDVNSPLASEVTEVSNCESFDTNKKDNIEENLETGFDLLNGELRTNPFPAKTESPVFRQIRHCCEFCGKLMRSSSEMLRHIRTHRPNANRLVRKCHQCLRLFADESSFELHMSLHDEPLRCGICQRSFVERAKLEQHVMKNHTTREELGCVPCKERLTSETELAIHMNRHLENNNFNLSESPGVDGETSAGRGGEFACDLCGKRFRGSGTLRKHAQSHTQERPHGCATCGKKFLRLEHLQLHERIHSGEKPFRCEICDYSSRQQNGLKTHMKQHSADNPFSCPGCGKQFSLLCRLKTHLLDATDRNDYSCPTCLVEFHYACALKDHAKTHAASKAFTCDVCCRKFSRKHDMMVHALLHSNAKPYVCGICKSGFASKSYVKEHLGSHIGDRRCCCNACDRVFKDSAELSSHMEQHIEGDWLKCRKCGRMLGNGAEFREHQIQCCAKNLSGCKRRKPPKKLSCDGEKRSYQCSDNCGYTTTSKSVV